MFTGASLNAARSGNRGDRQSENQCPTLRNSRTLLLRKLDRQDFTPPRSLLIPSSTSESFHVVFERSTPFITIFLDTTTIYSFVFFTPEASSAVVV